MDVDDDFKVLDEPTFGVNDLSDAIDAWDLDQRVRPEFENDHIRWDDMSEWNKVPDVEGIGEPLNTVNSHEERSEYKIGNDASPVSVDLCDQCRKDEIDIRNMESEIDRLRQQNAIQRYPSRTPPLRVGHEKERALSLERTKREQSRADKERYRLELLDQINEQKSRSMANEEWRRLDQSESDLEDAARFAAEKGFEDKKSRLEREQWAETLRLQMKQRKKHSTVDDAPYWWEIRRAFDDDSKHHLEQTRRNLLIQRSINSLNEFKAKQEEQDRLARQNQQAKYAKIREKIARESEIVREAEFGPRRQRFPKIVKAGNAVSDVWAAEHERNQRKYRVLQGGGGAVGARGEAPQRCAVKRCRKCSRVISQR